ncbi:MAG: cellulose biosynthesis cyclic di-GMP-binding regulatory protein BcsB [Pseudomonadota bacterium]
MGDERHCTLLATTKAILLAGCVLMPPLGFATAVHADEVVADDNLAFISTLGRGAETSAGRGDQNIDPTVVSSIVPAAIGNFRALGFHADGHRLSGETDSRQWTLHVTPQDAARETSFKLTFLNSIAVMPERSSLRVAINGRDIGSGAIRHADGYGELSFAVPSDVLRAGANLVSVTASQRHRIKCTVASVYELWTDLDLARSGFERAAATQLPVTANRAGDLSRLMGLPTTGDGSLPIDIYTPSGALISEQSFAKLQALLAQTVLAGNYRKPDVRFADASSAAAPDGRVEGFGVFIGSNEDYAQAFPKSALPEARRPSVMTIAGTQRPVLFLPSQAAGLVSVANRGQIESVQTHLARPAVTSHSSFTWAQAGQSSQSFNGRHMKSRVIFDMPLDFYAADYGVATLSVNAAHAGGLSPDAQLRVHVNGSNVASLKLASSRPKKLREKEVELPLRFFRPGENVVELEAVLAAPQDDLCDPRQRVKPPMRFALSDATSLRFDRLASAKTLPNLNLTLQTGFPYNERTLDAAPVALVVPDPTARSLTSALSTALYLTSQAGAVLPFNPHFGLPEQSMTNAVIVAERVSLPAQLNALLPAHADGSAPRAAANFNAFALPSGPATSAQSGASGLTDLPELNVTFQPLQGAQTPTASSLLEAIVGDALDSETVDAGRGFSSAIGSLWEPQSADTVLPSKLTVGRQHLSIRQIAAPNGKPGAWTIVSADNGQQLAKGVPGVFEAVRSNKLLGATGVGAVAYDNIDRTVTASIAPATTRLTSAVFSPRNEALLLAGWLSRHPLFYAFGLVALMMVFGALTHLIVRASGRSEVSADNNSEQEIS